jgi:uncharacterized protein YjbI with pentapeptide repeats
MQHRRKVTSPQAPDLALANLDAGSAADLADGADIDGREISVVRADSVRLRDATVMESRLLDVTSTDVDMRGATVRETEIERLDATVVHAWRGRWQDVRMSAGRLGTLEAYDAEWRAVELVGLKISFLNLRGSELTDVVVRDCLVDEIDLMEASVRRAAFISTDVRRLNLQGAHLRDVDLRGARLEEISGITGLRGTVVTSAQLDQLALLLAQELGVVVE